MSEDNCCVQRKVMIWMQPHYYSTQQHLLLPFCLISHNIHDPFILYRFFFNHESKSALQSMVSISKRLVLHQLVQVPHWCVRKGKATTPQKSRHSPLLRSCFFRLEWNEVPHLESLYHVHKSTEKIKIYPRSYCKECYSLYTMQIIVTIYGASYFTWHDCVYYKVHL